MLPKATQSVAPAVRRYVHHRDRGRCVVPGCNFGAFLDVHHLNPRAEGGGHDPENLVTLCDGHHTALHTGQLSLEGSPSTKLRFLRADGTKYTDPPSARAIAAGEQVFGALRTLGFSERQSKSAVKHVLETAETPCPATLLRAALALLTQSLA
ncbi:MAG: HNH endonuclease [Pseudomonadota bacterium]